MSRDDTKYSHALNLFEKIGSIRFKRLYHYFNTARETFEAPASELRLAGLEENVISEITEKRDRIDIELEMEKLAKENVKIITINDPEYPSLLKEIYDPPFVLYIKGNLKKEDFRLAVVGTRKASSYGKEVTFDIVKDLAKTGLTITSGLALGNDAFAHQATLDVKGHTVAVLGSGLDNIFPRANYQLAKEILSSGGALISEFPLGTSALKHHFPIRNRIISGLSLGTLVIEAGERSGALITAYQALEQNREVFAIPGDIFSTASKGTNKLIRKGAHLVSAVSDILDILNLENISNFKENRSLIPQTKEEKIILSCLDRNSRHIDKLVEESKLSPSQVNATLACLEMKGMVKNLGGMNYVLRA